MKRAIFFVLFLSMELLSFSQNLIVNPGFETWEKINKPVGWTTTQNCLKDSVCINSGNYSCRHEGGTTTKYLGQSNQKFKKFIGYSIRSLAEVVTCLHKAKRRNYITSEEFMKHYEFAFNLMNIMAAFKRNIK